MVKAAWRKAWPIAVTRMIPRLVLFGVTAFLSVVGGQASAGDPPTSSLELQGWQRSFAGPRDGAPAGVRALSQTPDGILWLGAIDGLYRHDGRSFERLPPSTKRPTQADTISALLATSAGDLWVGHDYGGLSLVRDGRHVPVSDVPLGTVWALPTNSSGQAWAVGSNSRNVYLARLVGRRWVSWVQVKAELFYGSAVGRDGTLWLILGDRLIAVSPSARRWRVVAGGMTSSSLVSGPSGDVWLVTPTSLRELVGDGAGSLTGRTITGLAREGDAPILFDDANHFWIVQSDDTLERYAIDDHAHATRIAQWHGGYTLTAPVLPLNSLPLITDREHALWMGTSQGLERFSRTSFVPVLAGASNSVINRSPAFAIADGRGAIWAWRNGQLFRAGAHTAPSMSVANIGGVMSPCASMSGGVWTFSGGDRLARVGGQGGTVPLGTAGEDMAKGLALTGCLEDDRGRLWGGGDHGLFLLDAGRGGAVPLGEDAGFSIGTYAPWRGGQVLAYVGNGNLWLTDGTHSRIVWRHADNTLGFIQAQYRTEDSILLGGDRGLGRFDGRSVKVISSARFPWLSFVAGVVQTPAGDTWLQTSDGVVRLRTAELDRAFEDRNFRPDVRIFRNADGVPGPPTYSNMSGLSADRNGRIWVSTANGIAVFDPSSAPPDGPAPPVLVTGIEADERSYAVAHQVHLPAGIARLRIQLAVIDFDNPMATRLSYRLQGMDDAWVDASGQRMAMFTNLAPGHYRFEVIGANSHGVWNRVGQSIEIDVAAHFWQTWWFALAAGLSLLVAIWLAARWRITQLTRRLRSQAAERANERERIAREIHDTLLQGMQGLVMRIQSIVGRMQSSDPNRQTLEQSLDRADALIAEGKMRVNTMHYDDAPADLVALLRQAMAEMPFASSVIRTVNSSGGAAPVEPVVAREVREIVAEALFNAARHANAANVAVDVVYGQRALEISVIDDGVGIAGHIPGSSGYGLTGMRKRAEGIGASLSIMGGATSGTSVMLRIPARKAYVPRAGFLASKFGRRRAHGADLQDVNS